MVGYWLVPNKSLKELDDEFAELSLRYVAKNETGP